MPFLQIILVALSMAMDAFAVCLAAGSLSLAQGPRSAFRLSFHFGLFQFIMPVVGWLAGATIEPFIRNYDHWVAFGLLAVVGGHMIYSALTGGVNKFSDPSRGWTLVLLSVAVSVDALAVGLSLGLLGIFVWYPATIIGVVTSLLSLIGLRLGNRLGRQFGKSAGILGGFVLIGIGLQIVISKLL